MKQYSIDRCELTWATLDFKEGLAQGSSIQEAKTTAPWSFKPTGMGGIVRVYNPDKSGIITITVDQESKLHQRLKAIALLDDVQRNQVFPMLLDDTSSDESFVYVNCFILNPPDEGRATESQTFPWQFGYEKKIPKPSSGDANLVGA